MIYCVGNSHVNTFSGSSKLTYKSFKNSYFVGCWIGPVIAYNFYKNHFGKLLGKIKHANRKDDYITLVVGEVDCRFHLPKQADEQNKTDEEIVKECIGRFMVAYDDLNERGYNILLTGTHPTTIGEHNDDPNNPVWGGIERRNNICLIWNSLLEDEAKKREKPFISIYKYLVDENNKTKMEFFHDYCHLNSSKIFPFLIKEFKKQRLIK